MSNENIPQFEMTKYPLTDGAEIDIPLLQVANGYSEEDRGAVFKAAEIVAQWVSHENNMNDSFRELVDDVGMFLTSGAEDLLVSGPNVLGALVDRQSETAIRSKAHR